MKCALNGLRNSSKWSNDGTDLWSILQIFVVNDVVVNATAILNVIFARAAASQFKLDLYLYAIWMITFHRLNDFVIQFLIEQVLMNK
jgi:hypothetical protein